ncbi:MAG: twin-arginine translocase subunit TatC, partial [Bauldia sp.]
EAFFIYLKLALISGTFIASPYIFYQIWMFVAPGLYAHEKKYVVPFVFFSTVLFTGGAIFGYFVIFPLAFEFLLHFAGAEVTAMPTMNSFFGFATRLLLAFGVVFEMPLAVFFLARVGVVTADQMRGVRRYAIIAAFIVGAILTPGPDPFSQCLMALPLILLYEVSIWVAKVFGRKPYRTMEEESEALAG